MGPLSSPSPSLSIRSLLLPGVSIKDVADEILPENGLNIRLNDEEIIALRNHLLNGGFLHADDNYGLNQSFRREMKRVFPNKDFVEIPHYHRVFHSYFDMPNGLPKIHEHDGKPPQLFGLFNEDKIMVLYSYESDLGDGWEDEEVHKNPNEIRLNALQMGVNIIYFALTQ